MSRVKEGVAIRIGQSSKNLVKKQAASGSGGAKIDAGMVREIITKEVKELCGAFVQKTEIQRDLEDAIEKSERASVTCQVLAYKLELMNQKSAAEAADKECIEIENETNRLISSFTPEQLNGPTRPKDFLRLFDSQNK